MAAIKNEQNIFHLGPFCDNERREVFETPKF